MPPSSQFRNNNFANSRRKPLVNNEASCRPGDSICGTDARDEPRYIPVKKKTHNKLTPPRGEISPCPFLYSSRPPRNPEEGGTRAFLRPVYFTAATHREELPESFPEIQRDKLANNEDRLTGDRRSRSVAPEEADSANEMRVRDIQMPTASLELAFPRV
ncbi:hypothetical protein KM043_006574 [Ampulex compressa]|nr:hypothetical protein KM043_006574 [Ampulex compressa]